MERDWAMNSRIALSTVLAVITFSHPVWAGGENGGGEGADNMGDNWKDLMHPYLILYFLHTVNAGIACALAMKAPIVLIVVMVLSGISYLVSALVPIDMWNDNVSTSHWWLGFAKWVIVNALATIPVCCIQAFKLNDTIIQVIGCFVYIILGTNVVWTLGFEMPDWIRVVNAACALSLTLSLIIHCCGRRRHGKKLFEKVDGMVYGYGTPMAWLVCYTIWNALFVAEYSMGMTLQDILFWAMMFLMQCLDGNRRPVDIYFAYARPVQLGSYIAFGAAMGLIPYFRETPWLAELQPLKINSHAYFLFIASCNFLWSLLCLFWAFEGFMTGDDGVQDSDHKLMYDERELTLGEVEEGDEDSDYEDSE